MSLAPITLSILFAMLLSPPGEWKKVTSKEGGFSVTMPGKVEQKTITEKTDEGPAEVRALVSEVDGITFLATGAVNSAKVPVDKNSPFFDNVRQSATTGPGKTLQKEQRGTFQKMPMCYFRYTIKAANGREFVVQARYLIGDPTHIYTLQVFVPKGVNIDAEIKRFFESFDRVEPTSKKSTKGNPTEPGGEQSPPIAAKWRPVTPVGKGFTVSLPGEPKHDKKELAENSIKIDTYAVDLNDRYFSAVYYEFPDSVAKQDPGTTLENLCKGLATGVNGKVIELKPVQDDGLEGREVVYEFAGPEPGKPVVSRARAYLSGAGAYVLIYGGEKGTEGAEDVRKFLDSFKLAKASAAKAKTKKGS